MFLTKTYSPIWHDHIRRGDRGWFSGVQKKAETALGKAVRSNDQEAIKAAYSVREAARKARRELR